jgi:hypothetical protein
MKSRSSVTSLIVTGAQSGIAVDRLMNGIYYEMLLDVCSVLVAIASYFLRNGLFPVCFRPSGAFWCKYQFV